MAHQTDITGSDFYIAYLTAEDLRLAASILYNAYLQDPFFHAIIPAQGAQFKQLLRALVRLELNHLWQQEQPLVGVFAGTRLLGLLCVTDPSDHFADKRHWLWRSKMMLAIGRHSTRQYIQREIQILTHLPKVQTGVVQFFGVMPCEQHHGVGQSLIQAMRHWCDEQPSLEGLALFVADEQYSAYFQQQGFSTLAKHLMGLPSQLLFYPAQSTQ